MVALPLVAREDGPSMTMCLSCSRTVERFVSARADALMCEALREESLQEFDGEAPCVQCEKPTPDGALYCSPECETASLAESIESIRAADSMPVSRGLDESEKLAMMQHFFRTPPTERV
jgi:hypothetical protein